MMMIIPVMAMIHPHWIVEQTSTNLQNICSCEDEHIVSEGGGGIRSGLSKFNSRPKKEIVLFATKSKCHWPHTTAHTMNTGGLYR
jgi:hypothetical protein